MTDKPFVFIGSSTEGLEAAKGVQANLGHTCECVIWSQGFFGLTEGTLETLVKSLEDYDFAILVLTEDDVTISRAQEQKSPRDNVIFELGLFIGGLGRDRTFIVINRQAKLKLPSDLAGITPATFEPPSKGTIQSALGIASSAIEKEIKKLGARKKVSNPLIGSEMIAAYQNIHQFCLCAKGYWWSMGADLESVGFVEFIHDEIIGTLEMVGLVYNVEGQLLANWNSIASCIHLKNKKLYYYWEGNWTKSPNDKNQGFGDIKFVDPTDNNKYNSGYGWYFDRIFGNVNSATMKRSDFQRCKDQEINTMQKNDIKSIGALLRKKLKAK